MTKQLILGLPGFRPYDILHTFWLHAQHVGADSISALVFSPIFISLYNIVRVIFRRLLYCPQLKTVYNA